MTTRRRIAVLPAEAVAGISAGEVIERPASVVKELVENSLDAGARRVQVDLEGGGLKLIRVTDDGMGIPSREAELAFSRHATSKLEGLDDLKRLGTFGFRGEALAAVASAGMIDLATRTPDASAGIRVTGGAGGPVSARPAGCGRGTAFEVKDLFRTMPARLKFLKSPSAEAAAVARVIEPYALTHLDVHFILTVDGEERLNAPPAAEGLDRVLAVIRDRAIELLPFDGGGREARARGYAQAPGTVNRRGRQWLHVNRRPIDDRALRHAVISSYGGQLPRDTQPFAAVFLEVPPADVDVNVHPAKAEVRFARPQEVYQAIQRALRAAFGARDVSGGGEPVPGDPRRAATGAPGSVPAGGAQEALPLAESPPPDGRDIEIFGQMFQTYVLARTLDGLLLVDQHTAHEKVIYERLCRDAKTGERQGLLIPQRLEFSAAEFAVLTAHAGAVRDLGIDFEEFGGRTVVVGAVPPDASDRDLRPLLQWLIEDLEQAGRAPSPGELDRKLRATMACHLAVKAGDRLDRPVMARLVHDLLALDDPLTCPHGRPTFVKHREGDLARLFRRTWGLGKRECH